MAEKTIEPTQQQRSREGLFRHNDLSHPLIQVLLNLKLEQPEEDQ
jgi:hypothetical protein